MIAMAAIGQIPEWFLLVITILGWVGTAIAWYWDNRKKRAEIHKLGEEAVKFEGDNLERLQKARSVYNDRFSECTKSARDLLHCLAANSSKDKIVAKREELRSALAERTLPALQAYVEWEHLRLKRDKQGLESFILEFVVPELGQYADWMNLLNSTEVLKLVERGPAKVPKATLRSFRALAVALSVKRRWLVERILSDSINQLIETPIAPSEGDTYKTFLSRQPPPHRLPSCIKKPESYRASGASLQ